MKKSLLSLMSLLLFTIGCTVNILKETGDATTSEAVLFEAKRAIDARDFDLAVSLLEGIDSTFMASRANQSLLASAYAGRCGLKFLSLLTSLQDGGSGTILSMLMGAFPGSTVAEVDDCVTAVGILQSIGDESERSGDENLLAAFVGLAKIGSILAAVADTDADGSTDAGFNQCDNTDLPEQMVREVGAGLGLAILSLGAVGAGYVDDALADIANLCAANANLAVFCTVSDPDTFNATQVQAFRYAIGSNDLGVNSCGDRDLATCALNNPVCP